NDSSSTLVGSALERKLNDYDVPFQKVDSAPRLAGLRQEMVKEKLDYYLVLSDDAHGTEIVAKSDRRREWITGFDGSAGTAIVSVNHAYLITDSRYWIQAGEQVDRNWTIVRGGSAGVPKDWAEWLLDHAHRNSRIGVDARMLSYEKATMLNTKLHAYGSKLVYPPQNLVDFVWRDKPPRSKEAVFIQPVDFAGESASSKLHRIRKWITEQPADKHVGTLLTALDQIAWTLNLRGSDIPFNPLFQAYLYVGLNQTILFLDAVKCPDDVSNYLSSLKVDRREYADIWSFLRLRHFGTGKVLISPQTSYAIALMLTSYRYTVTPSRVEHMMAIKNDAELEGLKRAYMRDGCAFIRFLAWLENKINSGFDVTEYEAAMRITEFRRHAKNFMGVAYENISATGPNAALPHYTPRRKTAALISRDTPYLHDSGGQYRDGTCDTTRTVHFGRPPSEQCEAYTKVLQGHIAIDSAIFPEGTSGTQLDVLARKALWKDGMNYLHGTGHGFGSFLTVHEGPHGFSSGIPLQPGHVVTNEPGYYKEGHWGMRIESALFVRRVTTKREYNGPVWLGFERLTYVPVQTRMVKENLLSKEEKAWIKEHNQRCYDIIAPYLKEDKRALKWLKREAERGIGLAPSAAGVSIEWD
ncbi:Creatinase/aminopeptidase, partial [Fistulina hepatica ATCC 64428]